MIFLMGMPLFAAAMDGNHQQQGVQLTSNGKINLNNNQLTALQRYSKTFKDRYVDMAEPNLMQVAPQVFPNIPISTEVFSDILVNISQYEYVQKKSVAKKAIINEVQEQPFDDVIKLVEATHFLDMPHIQKIYIKAFAERVSSDQGIELLRQELSTGKLPENLRNLPELLKELAHYAPHIRIQAISKDSQCADKIITKRKIPVTRNLASFSTKVWFGHSMYTVMTSRPDDGEVGDIMQISDDTTGKVIKEVKMLDRGGSLKFDALGKRFLYARMGPCLYLKDIRDNDLQSLDTGASISACTISHDGKKVASAHKDHVAVWDITTLSGIKKIREIRMPDQVLKVKFSAQDDCIVILTTEGLKKLNYADAVFDDYILSCKSQSLVDSLAHCLKLSPKYWVYNDYGYSMVYDVSNNSSCLLDKEQYSNFTFSLSDNYLAAQNNEKIKVWNVKKWITDHREPHAIDKYKNFHCNKMITVFDKYVIAEYSDRYFTDITNVLIWDFKENKCNTISLSHQAESGNPFWVLGNSMHCSKNEILMYQDLKSIARPIRLDELEIPIPEKPKKQTSYWEEFVCRLKS